MNNKLPITNKELWKPLAATYYIPHDNHYESIGLECLFPDTNDVDSLSIITLHKIIIHSNIYLNPTNMSNKGFEGIIITWKKNPFHITI